METIRGELDGSTGSTGNQKYFKTPFKYFNKDEKKPQANES